MAGDWNCNLPFQRRHRNNEFVPDATDTQALPVEIISFRLRRKTQEIKNGVMKKQVKNRLLDFPLSASLMKLLKTQLD